LKSRLAPPFRLEAGERWPVISCRRIQMSFVSRIGSIGALALTAALFPPASRAKPIAFAHGTTVMAEYGAGTMEELQVFYAPRFSYSIGGGYLALDSAIDGRSTDITYARLNFLAKRWNREGSQANVFVWGGVGRANVDGDTGNHIAWNAGVQFDYETRRIYTSLKSDLHESSNFSHRIDTLQLGLAPYEHDYDTVATWFVVQGRRYTGEIFDGTEWALLLRLFKGGKWIDVGATTDGKLQAMVMFNF
ncbi:MAG: hypothetical protein ACREIP_22215, partial [Alphaproteobacteria bacterium]